MIRIGILTYHRAHNYGAYLQAVSLCNRLNAEPDIACEILDYRTLSEERQYLSPEGIRKTFPLRYRFRHPFLYRFYLMLSEKFEEAAAHPICPVSKEGLVSDSIEDFSAFADRKYDILIAGSDEIWRTDSFRGYPTAYWLWGDLHAKKVAYAVSSRSDLGALDDAERGRLTQNLREFAYISVRDETTRNSLLSLSPDLRVDLRCDPSFLWDPPKIEAGSPKEKRPGGKKTALLFLDGEDMVPVAEKIRQALAGKWRLVSVFRPFRGYRNIAALSPLEWVETIRGADLVITSMFHGVCCSMIADRPYIALGTPAKNRKILSLRSEANDLSDRFLPDAQDLLGMSVDEVRAWIGERCGPTDNGAYVAGCRRDFESFVRTLREIAAEDGMNLIENGGTPEMNKTGAVG